MERFTKHTGHAVAIQMANIDTDQIIPKQFLKRIERTGYGDFLFYDRRFRPDGTADPDFILNEPRHAGASILISGPNFGCGSSREHAPWALSQFGFRTVIAPSFADIFYNNSLKNGLLPVVLSDSLVAFLAERSRSQAPYALSIDLEMQTVADGSGFCQQFEIDPFQKHCLLNGLDDIARTLEHGDSIANFERSRPVWANIDRRQ